MADYQEEVKIIISVDPAGDLQKYLETQEVDIDDTVWFVREIKDLYSMDGEFTFTLLLQRTAGDDDLDVDTFCTALYEQMDGEVSLEINEIYER